MISSFSPFAQEKEAFSLQHKKLPTPWGEIHYLTGGQGPALVLLHGNKGSHRDFSKQLPALAQHFTIYALDTRGHGGSEYGSASMTISTLAQELHFILHQLAICHCSLLGFSDGGNIALKYALLWPEDLSSLVIAGANIHPQGLRFSVLVGYRLWTSLSKLLQKIRPSMRNSANILSLVTQNSGIRYEDLQQILKPVLLMAGEKDIVLLKHTLGIAHSLPHCFVAIIPKAHHNIFREQGYLCNAKILSFLLKNTSSYAK